MKSTRTLVLVALVALSLAAVPLAAGGVGGAGTADGDAAIAVAASPTIHHDQEADEPRTNETLGYVEGVRHDDELDVDNSDGLNDSELEAVVYRSMARVEIIRERPFEEAVPVEVVGREAYAEQTAERFADINESERLEENVRAEALFMVDRDTDAVDEWEQLYSGGVGGHYDPETNQIVIVSENTESPQMNEVVLGHELVHALQDQYFDLLRFDALTRNGANAENGLIEGDASWVENEYDRRCGTEWNCVSPDQNQPQQSNFNVGLYVMLYQPYSDGPSFVDHLYENGGWDAVDAAYDDPPTASSEIIRPEEYGTFDAATVTVEDRSSDRWERVTTPEIEREHSELGEAGLFSMLLYPTFDSQGQFSIISQNEFITGDEVDPYDYDHEYTDGWAGDRMHVYATEDRSIDETGYVWEIEWQSEDDAEQFLEGYVQLLEYNDADPVEDRANTFVIDEEFPGAYYVEHDGTTVTIVRAPSVDELAEIHEGAAPDGEDTILLPSQSDDDGTETETGDDGAETDAEGDGTETEADDNSTETDAESSDDEMPGFGPAIAVVAVLASALLATRHR